MRSLQKKLLREIWHIRGQVLAIMLVIAGGVGVCIMSLSAYDSLQQTRDNYYRDYHFADVFVSLKRAPNIMLERVLEIDGINTAESRVQAYVNIQLAGFDEPVSGIINSIPDSGQPRLNRLHLLKGTLPDSRRDNEILLSDTFAEAHKLKAGDTLSAVINGRYRELRIVGIALSPEYVYQIAPGSLFPDYQRFAVMWMAQTPLAAAYGMQSAFNQLSLQLQREASEQDVIMQLDTLLARYGSLGAHGRDEQYSNMFLQEEFNQLQTMAYLFPLIFLTVAIFLINVVVSRLVNTQKEIIAILKAFGYSSLQIAWHYAQLVLIISALGIAGGIVLGMYLGHLIIIVYADYFRFPQLLYVINPLIIIAVALVCLVAALSGCLRAVMQAAKLPPAEAMRPEKPANYHKTVLGRLIQHHLFSPPFRIILRHLAYKPLKTLLSVIGLALALAIMMIGNFQENAINYLVHVQFQLSQKQDIELHLHEPVSDKALSNLLAIDGVLYAEPVRNVPVRLHFKNRNFRTSLQGINSDAQLQVLLDTQLNSITLPQQGVMVTRHLADKLGFRAGDMIEVEMLDGRRQTLPVNVSALSEQYMGLGSYMRREQLNRLLNEGPAFNSVLLSIDKDKSHAIYQTLNGMPGIAAINLRQTIIDNFRNMMDEMILIFILFNALLGGVIAFGVVYNTVRIALAEHARELASLRVLGYTRAEVAYILLGELALLTLASLPLGFVIGTGLCHFMAQSLATDMYRIPLALNPTIYAFSALIVILAATLSAMIVWRKLYKLNLVEVLKTRE